MVIDLVGFYEFCLRLIGFFEALLSAVTSNMPNAFIAIGVYFSDIDISPASRFFYELEDITTFFVDAIGEFIPVVDTLYYDLTLIEGYMYLCIGAVVLLGFFKLIGDILPT